MGNLRHQKADVRFVLLALGNIHTDAIDAGRSLALAEGLRAHEQPTRLPIGPNDAEFILVDAALNVWRLPTLIEARPIIGLQEGL